MRILLVTTKYPESFEDSYLSSDLADEWARSGHDVTVSCLQWEKKGAAIEKQVTFPSGVRVNYSSPISFSIAGKFVDRVSRWMLSSLLTYTNMKSRLGNLKEYDVFILFAPASVNWRLAISCAQQIPNNYIYITDFFPYQARNVGLVPPGIVFSIVKRLENLLISRFSTVGTMTPMNAQFFKDNYDVTMSQRVVVDPLWGPDSYTPNKTRDEIRDEHRLPQDRRLLLLGGQLCEGRGIDEIIGAAELCKANKVNAAFLLVGDGRLRPMVESAARELPEHLIYRDAISRDRYIELASACDVGLVVTDPTINAPTFSTRTIDYMRVGLPIIASTEACTDFGEIIAQHRVGLHTVAGNPEKLVELIEIMFQDPTEYQNMKDACLVAANGAFNVKTVAESMLNHATGKFSSLPLHGAAF